MVHDQQSNLCRNRFSSRRNPAAYLEEEVMQEESKKPEVTVSVIISRVHTCASVQLITLRMT